MKTVLNTNKATTEQPTYARYPSETEFWQEQARHTLRIKAAEMRALRDFIDHDLFHYDNAMREENHETIDEFAGRLLGTVMKLCHRTRFLAGREPESKPKPEIFCQECGTQVERPTRPKSGGRRLVTGYNAEDWRRVVWGRESSTFEVQGSKPDDRESSTFEVQGSKLDDRESSKFEVQGSKPDDRESSTFEVQGSKLDDRESSTFEVQGSKPEDDDVEPGTLNVELPPDVEPGTLNIELPKGDPGPGPMAPEVAAIREDVLRTLAQMDETIAGLMAAGAGTGAGKERTESRERNLQPVQVE